MNEPPPAAPARTWVYPLAVRGAYQRIHRWSGVALQAILLLVPWFEIGGHPAVQIDIPGRRLYAFGAAFTPADTMLLAIAGLATTFGLFLFTALYGRLWCGYACPQTVFLEEWVRPIERWVEGDRPVRRRRDQGPWTVDRAWRKAVKWTLFAGLSIAVSLAAISWFAGARATWTGGAGPLAYGIAAVLATTLFIDLAWFREQLCAYLCPYARLQSVLCDDDSLVVAYNAPRGEPRRRVRREDRAALTAMGRSGACIDCRKCVAVCPQGIDIRNGFQLDCVMCARCVDACEGVMAKRGEPSLVRYAPLSGKKRPVRVRTVVYGSLIGVLSCAFLVVLLARHDIDGMVTRAPGTLYTTDTDGWIRNTYLLRLTSHESTAETWEVSVEGLPADAEVSAPSPRLDPAATATVPVVVRIAPTEVSARSLPLRVRVRSHDDELLLDTTFVTPGA